MITPKLSKLESKFYVNLLAAFPDYDIKPEFDDDTLDLDNDKVTLVIKYLGDRIEGNIITNRILHPTYTFILFTRRYLKGVSALESLIEYFDVLSANDLTETDWAITHFYKQNTIMPIYDPDNRYYVGSVDYNFHLTSAVII